MTTRQSSNPLWVAIMSSYNTQLCTIFGYYLSLQPTIQQLKK
jgi:hypothetical protein